MPDYPCRPTRSDFILLFSLTALFMLATSPRTAFAAGEKNAAESASPNHGLVVCAPRVKGTSSTDRGAFGDACGWYLAVTVGGRPEFGRTPMLSSVERIRLQRGFPNLRLDPGPAAQIVARTGATLSAIGEIEEKGEMVSLSYQFYTVKGQPVKTAVRLQGTRATIIQRLPQFSNQIAALFGVRSLPAPAVKASVAEMVQLGQSLPQQKRFQPEQEETLATLRKNIPLAALVYLYSQDAFFPTTNFDAAAKVAVDGFPENSLVFSHFGNTSAERLAPFKAQLAALSARYPQNYAFAAALVWSSRYAKDYELEMKTARRLVRIAPQNPDAFLTLSSTIADSAERIRQSRFIGQMTEEELAAVEKIYPEWLATVGHAVELDPQFAHAWLRVSSAASFAGEREIAIKAWARSRLLGEGHADVYLWGLQLFQEKWGGTPEELALIAHQAVDGDYRNSKEQNAVANRLKSLGFEEDARRLLERHFLR